MLDGMASARDGEMLEDLGDENEEDDDGGGEGFADRERRTDGDGHRQLHRHALLEQGGQRLAVDGIAADDGREQRDHVQARDGLPEVQAAHGTGERDEHDATELDAIDMSARLRGGFRELHHRALRLRLRRRLYSHCRAAAHLATPNAPARSRQR